MINFQYPTTRTLRQINPEKIINLQRNRPTFQLFPQVDDNAWRVEWQQKDNYRGFQQLRGLNGEPSYVKMVGFKRYSQEPGVWGEYMTVDEAQMTTRAQYAVNESTPVPIGDLVAERQDYLNNRETDLLEWMHWAILLSGTFTLLGPTGAIYAATFPLQTATFSDVAVHTTSTPISDRLGLKLLTRGRSVSFGAGAVEYMNATTIADILLNRNANDLGGQWVSDQNWRTASPITLANVNTIFTAQGIPTIVEYEEGYNRESDGAFTLWIPNYASVIVGRRTNGDRLGEHRMVRNINNDNNAAGRYTKVIDSLDREVPRKISVHQGHNGGLVIYYPSAIIRATSGTVA